MSDLTISDHSDAATVRFAASALAERGAQVHACPNCDAPMIGAYCGICGQERDTHRRSVWRLLHDFFEDIISFDSRILRTVIALLVEPGEIAIAFREGRTRRFVPPIRLYFFVTLLFFVILSMTGLAIMQLEVVATEVKVTFDARGNAFIPNPAYDKNDSDAAYEKPLIPLKGVRGKDEKHYNYNTRAHFFAPIGIYHSHLTKAQRDRLNTFESDFDGDSKGDQALTVAERKEAAAKREQAKGWIERNINGGIRRLTDDPAALNGPLTTWLPRALFLLMPLYALLLAAEYWRQRKDFYFVDHLIFSLTVHTFTFVVLIADAGLAQFLSGEAVAWITFVSIALYIFIAMKRFYRQGWIWTTIKFLSVSFIYTCFFLAPALGAVIVVSFFGGQFG